MSDILDTQSIGYLLIGIDEALICAVVDYISFWFKVSLVKNFVNRKGSVRD